MSIDFSNLSDAQIGSILALVSSDEVREARNRLSLEGVSNAVTVEPFTITCNGFRYFCKFSSSSSIFNTNSCLYL